MPETVSSVTILATSSFIIVGLLRFLIWFARTSNGDYQALSRLLDKERKEKLDALSERDEARLKALTYSDQRDQAISYASHWRDEYIRITQQPPLAPPPIALAPDHSQITRFDLDLMRVEVEREKTDLGPVTPPAP